MTLSKSVVRVGLVLGVVFVNTVVRQVHVSVAEVLHGVRISDPTTRRTMEHRDDR